MTTNVCPGIQVGEEGVTINRIENIPFTVFDGKKHVFCVRLGAKEGEMSKVIRTGRTILLHAFISIY